VIFVIVLPFLGVLTYLIFNHDGMAERTGREAAASQAQFDDYVRQTTALAVRPARSRRRKAARQWHHHPVRVRRDQSKGDRIGNTA